MVLTDKDIARLSKLYYEEGYTLGRDAIYSVLKKEYKKPPSKGSGKFRSGCQNINKTRFMLKPGKVYPSKALNRPNHLRACQQT